MFCPSMAVWRDWLSITFRIFVRMLVVIIVCAFLAWAFDESVSPLPHCAESQADEVLR